MDIIIQKEIIIGEFDVNPYVAFVMLIREYKVGEYKHRYMPEGFNQLHNTPVIIQQDGCTIHTSISASNTISRYG